MKASTKSSISATPAATAGAPLLTCEAWGAATALGQDWRSSLAAWVAQTRRFRRRVLPGFADAVTVADCPWLAPELAGADRLAALLRPALADLRSQWVEDTSAAQTTARTAARTTADEAAVATALRVLVLPTWLDAADGRALVDRLSGAWGVDETVAAAPLLLHAGADGAWRALAQAYGAMAAMPTQRTRDHSTPRSVLIACVDSLCEPGQLQAAAEAGRLLKRGHGEGFIPGEAAVCVHLRTVARVQDVRAEHFALHAPACAEAASAWWPSEQPGDSGPLSDGIERALANASLQPEHISHLCSDMDGSAWRARLESEALTRSFFAQAGEVPHWRTAMLFGQIGNAGGALGWLLAAQSHLQRLERVNTVLTWAADPAGHTAAAVMERSPVIAG